MSCGIEEKKLPERKPTRLSNFDYSRGGAYFLTICTQDRKRILSEVVETEKPVGDGALDIPKIRLTRYGRIVEKYILSSNKIDVKAHYRNIYFKVVLLSF